jgi:DNA-binding response OmpR family regulator
MDERASKLAEQGTYLLVEDEPVLRRLVRAHLTRKGLDVAVASSIAEAVHELEQHTVSHLITDAILPDGMGFELLPLVRKQPAQPMVLLMSGDESVGKAVRELAEPRIRFLLKPFTMAALEAALASTDRDV